MHSFASNAAVVWLYWILGTYDSHIDTLAYTTAILRNAESIGFAISFAIGANSNISLLTNLVVSCIVFGLSVPFTTYAAWNIEDVIISISHPSKKDCADADEVNEQTSLFHRPAVES